MNPVPDHFEVRTEPGTKFRNSLVIGTGAIALVLLFAEQTKDVLRILSGIRQDDSIRSDINVVLNLFSSSA